MNEAQLRRLALAKIMIEADAKQYEKMRKTIDGYTKKERTVREENIALPGGRESIRLLTPLCLRFWHKCFSLYKRVCQFTVRKKKEARQ